MPYSGVDRREVIYCNVHEQNTKDIVALKTRIAVWQGIIGGIVTIGLAIVMYMVDRSNMMLDKIYSKLDYNTTNITRLEEKTEYLDHKVATIEAQHIRDIENRR